ncbi:E3 ubiquitin-protein ligase ZNRF4 [Indicator indicator]|uniref:E3 ubiquitin-protein ligase ZNRF4 n=1 Tax=Indicator indicator TaxID=1002788 RepID=UPI0023DFFD65|nr:E3 ubiquitin-protein ligase ZNRF4 [Indicator indicator]
MNPWLHLLHFVLALAFCSTAPAEAFAYLAYNDSSQCVAYKAQPACFGPQLPAEELTAYVTEVRPPNACRAIENPPAPRTASDISVALIKAEECSFVQKVLHAQQAGYQIAVVHSLGSEQLITMKAEDKEIQQLVRIPSLFAGQSLSLHLQRVLQCKGGEYIKLLPPKRGLSPCEDSAKVLQEKQDSWIRFCGVGAAVSVVAGLVWYQRAHKAKQHTSRQGDQHKACVLCMAKYKKWDPLKIQTLSPSHTVTSVSEHSEGGMERELKKDVSTVGGELLGALETL